jgi:hypothetical protein
MTAKFGVRASRSGQRVHKIFAPECSINSRQLWVEKCSNPDSSKSRIASAMNRNTKIVTKF